MKNIFKDILKGKVVIVGVGNTLRRDDGFGPILIEKLGSNNNLVCFDVGTSPENYMGRIIKEKPGTILIVDCIHLEKQAGDYDILDSSEIVKSGFTTHDLSPKMFLDYLSLETKASIYLLGIQPQDVSFGEGMSKELNSTLKEITKLLMEIKNARDTLN
ncbi:MAG: hydrogenase 3 maturation endopeptidase HyCI [Omnitrophica bacterium]|nr:hydrogenase 3 maturation endopeptidase HyCI [Candidatus Omnitrophota bacterium]